MLKKKVKKTFSSVRVSFENSLEMIHFAGLEVFRLLLR